MKAMYVTVDPASLRRAEDAAYREQQAGSCVLSVTRISAEELRRQAFWQQIESRPDRRREPRLRLVR